MDNNTTPFLAQANLLKRYIYSPDPSSDPEAVEVIIEMLKTVPDLRRFFFQSSPSAAWASILFDNGLFASPPPPKKTKKGYVLQQWDIQYYLQTVAPQIPDVIVKYIVSIDKWDSWYISSAIPTLSCIPTDKIKIVIPKILGWLKDPLIAWSISDSVMQLIEVLCLNSENDIAIEIFRALTDPYISSESKVAQRKRTGEPDVYVDIESVFSKNGCPVEGFELLKKEAPLALISILETHLLVCLGYEAADMTNPNYEFLSWWRSAIEDSDQNISRSYKDHILCALRDTIEVLSTIDSVALETIITNYLQDPHSILRRLGLYMLFRCPQLYPDLVRQELLRTENLDDIDIHHEYFMLLREGFSTLAITQQQLLISEIIEGPDKERLLHLVERVKELHDIEPKTYISQYTKKWMRDRLWMIKDFLAGVAKALLDEYIEEIGIPEHPEFLSWTTGVYAVREVSPFSEDELKILPADKLLELVQNWQPDPTQQWGPEVISYEGLARAISNITLNDLEQYASYLLPMAKIHPEFAYRILSRWTDSQQIATVPWDIAVKLCKQLLQDINRNEFTDEPSSWINWTTVRISIARLLEVGFLNSKKLIPNELLGEVKNLLLILIDDPDPNPQTDRSSEVVVGHLDPFTEALNHVRPIALRNLIEYANRWTKLNPKGELPDELRKTAIYRFEADVGNALSRKLNSQFEPSWAVRSIYGQYLNHLFWLDQTWLKENIDKIFPSNSDEGNIWLFIVAMGAYCRYNHYYSPMVELMIPIYRQAIHYLNQGYILNGFTENTNNIAIHLMFEYLFGDYDILSVRGQNSLIFEFFNSNSLKMRQSASWACRRICVDNLSELDRFWPRARRLLEWRLNQSITFQHSPDFDPEMENFACLLDIAPSDENLITLRPIIEGLLPHIARSEYRNLGWDALEKYLAKQVTQNPVDVIRIYRKMHEQKTSLWWSYQNQEERKIIETAIANPHARQDTLSLIDWFARRGHNEYQDIYERYTTTL